jgi:hypothetical protein
MKTGNSSYVAKLSAETTKTTFDLEEKERKEERERDCMWQLTGSVSAFWTQFLDPRGPSCLIYLY